MHSALLTSQVLHFWAFLLLNIVRAQILSGYDGKAAAITSVKSPQLHFFYGSEI